MKVFTYKALMNNGRLGNQLWQIASTMGLAEQVGGIARFNPNWEYRKFFSVPDQYFDPIPDGAQVFDRGSDYLQELHYWDGIQHLILDDFFKPSSAALDQFKRTADTCQPENAVSLHVRRGDYLKYPDHFPLPSSEYYRRAMDHMRSQNSDTVFWIFSDDMQFCQRQFRGANDVVFVNQGAPRPVEVRDRRRSLPTDFNDLFLMANCGRHIIANSSFSWWGAMLARSAEVVYPSVWYGRALSDIQWHKMIPKSWTGMDST